MDYLNDIGFNAQALVNSGMAWRLEGHIGRQCMGLIDAGVIMLGKEPRTDYYGNPIPSRYQVVAGTKGSPGYVKTMALRRAGIEEDN